MFRRKFLAAFRRRFVNSSNPDRFLADSCGVVHVGANAGQEAKYYDGYGLNVLWIEPIPEIYNILEQNISGYPCQVAIQALISDNDTASYGLNVASNQWASSSILSMKDHKAIWPSIEFVRKINVKGITLPSLFAAHSIDSSLYDSLVIDTQGTELAVLRGASGMLPDFKYIKVEVPDFEAYLGCCQLNELSDFLNSHGFEEHSRVEFISKPGIGSCFDVVYKRNGFQGKEGLARLLGGSLRINLSF